MASHVQDFVQIGPLKIAVMRGGSGSPVVVLHQDIGNPGWLPFYDQLAEHHTVYVPSHAGFGKSDRPDWARNVRDLAGLQQWVLKELGMDAVPLVGLGFGGWMAAEMATMSPRQFPALVLVGAVGIKPTEGEIMDQFLVSTVDYIRSGFHDQSKFEELFGADPDLDQLEQWEINREMTTRVAWKPYLFNPGLAHLLGSVSARGLVVWGQEDRQVPLSVGEQYVQGLPNAHLHVLDQCGHYAEIEKSDHLARLVVDFLGG